MTDTQDAVARYDKYVELTDRTRAALGELRKVQQEALDYAFEVPVNSTTLRILHGFVQSVWNQEKWYEITTISADLLNAARYEINHPVDPNKQRFAR